MKAAAFNLADSLSYQKDSVVSREIVNKKTGTFSRLEWKTSGRRGRRLGDVSDSRLH